VISKCCAVIAPDLEDFLQSCIRERPCDGAAGVPVEPVGEQKSAEADRHKQWREVGVGAQILRDLGVTSIRHLTSSTHDYKGLSGFGIEIVSNEQLEV